MKITNYIVIHKLSHLVSTVTFILPLLECVFGEVQYLLRILQCLYEGNLLKGIKNCLIAAQKAVRFPWMLPFRKYFLENIMCKEKEIPNYFVS